MTGVSSHELELYFCCIGGITFKPLSMGDPSGYLLFLISLQYSGSILRMTTLPLFIKILIRLTHTRLMSHMLFPWILQECCGFFSNFGSGLCRWVAICRTVPSYLRKQLRLNVSTPSLKWIISPASFSGEHGKSLIFLNWFVAVIFKVFFEKKAGAFLQILNRAVCFGFCPAPFPLAQTPAMLLLCYADVSWPISCTKDGLMGVLFSIIFQNRVIKIFSFLFPVSGLQWKGTGWAHEVCRPCGTQLGHRGNSF